MPPVSSRTTEQVGAGDPLLAQRARVVERRDRAHRAQVGEQPEPLAHAEQALLRTRLARGRSCPISARRRRRAAPRRRRARPRAPRRSARRRGRRSRRRRRRAPRPRRSRPRASTSSAGGHHLGADAVAGQRHDPRHRPRHRSSAPRARAGGLAAHGAAARRPGAPLGWRAAPAIVVQNGARGCYSSRGVEGASALDASVCGGVMSVVRRVETRGARHAA